MAAHQAPPSLGFSRQEDSPGNWSGLPFPLQCMKVKSESGVTQSCPTLCDPMDCSPPGSSAHGIFQARVLEWGAIAFSKSSYSIAKLPSVCVCKCPSRHTFINNWRVFLNTRNFIIVGKLLEAKWPCTPSIRRSYQEAQQGKKIESMRIIYCVYDFLFKLVGKKKYF